MWRVMPSVPRQPMTVVTPLETMSSIRISGARVAGPPSPPPPRMWTCGSMSPGRTRFPAASTISASSPSIRMRPGSVTASIDAAGEQDVLPAERLGRMNERVSDERRHGVLLGGPPRGRVPRLAARPTLSRPAGFCNSLGIC